MCSTHLTCQTQVRGYLEEFPYQRTRFYQGKMGITSNSINSVRLVEKLPIFFQIFIEELKR